MILPDKIVEWCDVGPTEYHNAGITYRDYLALNHVKRGLGSLPVLPVEESDLGPPLYAFVNFGQWLAECPTCHAAVSVCHHHPFFICPSCGSGGKWSQVRFPEEEEEITWLLLNRPGFRTSAPDRNWVPTETPMDLRLQNIQRGDAV